MRPHLVWFRNDLRVDDHALLREAHSASGGRVLGVWVFEERWLTSVSPGFAKAGPRRLKFILESVAELRRALRELGSDLVVRRGPPHEAVAALATEIDAAAVWVHDEPTPEEEDDVEAVARALGDDGRALHRRWGRSLFHVDDLPFAPADLPKVFTQFRKACEAQSHVRDAQPAPDALDLTASVAAGELPDLASLVGPERAADARRYDERDDVPLAGGERAGRARLHGWIWERDRLRSYKTTRNGLVGADYASRLSPWLAVGALSPRRVFAEVRRYERERERNESTYWLIFELIWRDFFTFVALQHGWRLFAPGGLRDRPMAGSHDRQRFEAWRRGETGVPFVDAGMRELAATGFLSNRARQNVASFLTADLGVDWRWGARWFEHALVDYDPCSNWGNWAYVAGVGNDPRDRWFNVVRQGRRYDEDGEYVRRWCPELGRLPSEIVHEPWAMSAEDRERFGCHWPEPIVDMTEVSARAHR